VIALWLVGKLLKTKDAVQLALDRLGTVGSLLGEIGIKDFTARCHPSFSAPLRFSWTTLGWLWAVRSRLAV
jgi:hypothetical protein